MAKLAYNPRFPRPVHCDNEHELGMLLRERNLVDFVY